MLTCWRNIFANEK